MPETIPAKGPAMFQSFTETARPEQGPPRLARLRAAMDEAGLAGFLVPRADAHQGEYVAPCDARLEWLTGFTGSAGFCAVLADAAGVFVDSRYRVQARAQVDGAHFTPVDWPATKLSDWLIAHLPEGGDVGFDPWLYTPEQIDSARAALGQSKVRLVPCDNLIDAIWPTVRPRRKGPLRPGPTPMPG